TASDDPQFADGDALGLLWDNAQRNYDEAQRYGEGVARALRLADLAVAELPYLSRWLLDPLGGYGSPDDVAQVVNDRLLPLIERSHALAADIAAHHAAGDDGVLDAPPFVDRLDQFEQDLNALGALLSQRIAVLETSDADDPALLSRIEAILQTPLPPARSREALRARLAELSQRLHAGARPAAASPPADVEAIDYLTQMATLWREHPVLEVLDDPHWTEAIPADASGAAGLAGIADAKGAEVRRRLRSLPEVVTLLCDRRAASETTSGAAMPSAVPGYRVVRDRWSKAERMTRAASSFWFPAIEEDPFEGLRQLDRQQWLLWRVERTLKDFWAGVDPGDPPFFDVAADDEMGAAAIVFPLRPETQRQVDRLNSLLKLRRTTAAGAASVTAADILLTDASAEATTTVVLRPAPLPADAVPPGRSVVFLRDARGRLRGASLGLAPPLAIGSETAAPWTAAFEFRGEDLVGRGPVLQAVAMFRGHQFTAPLVLRVPGGTIAEYRPYEYGLSRISVDGARRRPASVVFILDCSQSMSAAEELEAPVADGAPPRQTTRLDVAKGALNMLLDDLAQRPGWRVGVRLFGHRVGWNREKPEELESLLQTGYGRPIPAGIRPANDEESILPVGRFDSVQAGRVENLLDTVRPWGETPLYLSLDRALRELDNEAPDAERFVVAITDGANRQTNARPQDARSMADVLATNRTRRAKMYIVGFDIPRAESAAEREFRRIAEASGGRYVPATNAQDLLDALQEALGPGEFSVSDGRGEEVAREEVGGTAIIDPAPLVEQPYVVTVDSLRESVFLEGGEALELVTNPLRGRVESVRYETGSPQFLPLADDAGATEYLLGVHRPITGNDGVAFTVSLQRSDRGFTPRPAEVWLEVTPVNPDDQTRAPSYLFYDAPSEPDTPVPVLRRLAPNWPRGYRQGELRFWSKMEKTPAAAVRLEEVADRPPAAGAGYIIPGVAGVTYQVRTHRGASPGAPFRVALIERHGVESPGVGAVKVEMSPAPQHALHQFDAENRLVLHTFEFATAEDPSGLSREILFTPRADIETGAMHLDDAAIVEITDTGNLIELNPPR
ncbi:MAG: hypothetical protein KY475_12650, partial [Planctomycetes bacterium]|nr:hypothetical protein [Planctomycetota bacterium]